MTNSPGHPFLKRTIDLILASSAAVLLFPVFILVAILIGIKLGRPVVFKQERAGLKGCPFCIYKFRTMTNALGPDNQLLPDEIRLTRFGRFLRSTSLDELPQIFNVIRGEMSIVGPRPLYISYIERYSATQRKRLDVLPGITGLAQVSGRNALSWEEKFQLDVEYVNKQSLLLDLKLLAMTFISVFKRTGISEAGKATMSEFFGCKAKDGVHG